MIQTSNKKVNIFLSNVRAKILYQHLILNTARVSSAHEQQGALTGKRSKAQPVQSQT